LFYLDSSFGCHKIDIGCKNGLSVQTSNLPTISQNAVGWILL
jgi:hypothetical protein